jgi:hypothetical protein
MHYLEDTKPVIVWAGCLLTAHLYDGLHIVAGIVSIGYTGFKIYIDVKNHLKNKNNEKQ